MDKDFMSDMLGAIQEEARIQAKKAFRKFLIYIIVYSIVLLGIGYLLGKIF